MSVEIKYKGNTIASASTDTTKTLKTSGKYCEADIEVINTPDGGGEPVINPLSVTENGTYNAPSGVDGYSPVTVNVPQGITPSGTIDITDTNVTDVTNYATAQVVDADLVASNIKKDVNILGIIGTFEGGGGLPTSISKIDGGSFTPSSDTKCNTYYINHNLGEKPKGFIIWNDNVEQYTAGTKRTIKCILSIRRTMLNQSSSITSLSTDYFSMWNADGTPYHNQIFNYATQAQVDREYANDTICFNYDSSYYGAGMTYKWIAWA